MEFLREYKYWRNNSQFRPDTATGSAPLFCMRPLFASRLLLRVIRDPVIRAMEGGGRAVGHVLQPSTTRCYGFRLVALWSKVCAKKGRVFYALR
jgi:hypothetical protein